MSCMKKDYYLILRLTPEATAEEIRSAYRRLAIELHPDLSGFGSDQFLELQEAYSVLSDPMRRAVYDREAEEIPVRRTDVARPADNRDRAEAFSRAALSRSTSGRIRRYIPPPVV